MSNYLQVSNRTRRLLLLFSALFYSNFIQAMNFIKTYSGHHVPLHVIRQYVPDLQESELHVAVYEYFQPNILFVGNNHSISILDLAPRFARVPICRPDPVSFREECLQNDKDGLYIREGSGYTFIFNEHQHTLITAWGPEMMLVRIECDAGSRIFVNTVAGSKTPSYHTKILGNSFTLPLSLQTKPDISLNPVIRQPPSQDVLREFRILFLYDKSLLNNFCGSYAESNKMIAALVNKLEDMFADVGIVLQVEATNAETVTSSDPYALPEKINHCFSKHGVACPETSMLLKHFRSVQKKQDPKRDATVVLTGFGLNSGAVGATYIGGACSRLWGWAWIKYTEQTVNFLSHELAHLLGAFHDKDGTVSSAIAQNNDLQFSEHSKQTLREFIKKKSSPWCLKKVNRNDDIGKVLLQLPSYFEEDGYQILDLTFADPSDLYSTQLSLLFARSTPKTNHLYISNVLVFRKGERGGFDFGPSTFPLQVPNVATGNKEGGSIAFGNIQNHKTNDLVVAYIESSRTVKYKVCLPTDTKPIEKWWSPAYDIPVKPNMRVRAVRITICVARNLAERNLVVVLITEDNKVYYEIGWNFDAMGNLEGRWSKIEEIPNLFISNGSIVSVAVYKTQPMDQSSLVLYYSESGTQEHREVLRFGQYSEKLGCVQGGWTEPVPAPGLIDTKVRAQGIDISTLPGDAYPTAVMLFSSRPTDSKIGRTYIDFGLSISQIAQTESDENLFESIADDRSSSCLECYRGVRRIECEEKVRLCVEYGLYRNDTKMFSNFSRADLSTVRNRYNEAGLYCVGFDDFLIRGRKDACEKESPRENIVVHGTALLLSWYLNSNRNSNETLDVSSYTVEFKNVGNFESPKNTSHGGRPQFRVKISFTLEGQGRRAVVLKALKKLKQTTGFKAAYEAVDAKVIRNGNVFIVKLKFIRDFPQKNSQEFHFTFRQIADLYQKGHVDGQN